MIKTILFDLDGALLPMEQDDFLKAYMGGLARKMAPYGYEPQSLIKAIWTGTGAMVQNDGKVPNMEAFWATFCAVLGRDARADEPIFEDFYCEEFQQVRQVCGYTPMASQTIQQLKDQGYTLVLATNPLFPAIATHSRIRWAGLRPEDFALVTTYENSCRCKPNPGYYRDILDTLGLNPEECLMVGNDIGEDMIAQTLGMQVFLLTDHLINKDEEDITRYLHGSFPELMAYLQTQ